MSQFKELKVKEIVKETPDAVSVAFDIEGDSNYSNYVAGQYVTLKASINGEDVRRSYSLCSAPFEDDFRVAVKKIDQGKMSTFLNDMLQEGTTIEVMPPEGNFSLTPNNDEHYVAFTAGSGITPIISMIKVVLNESNSKFSLFYSNRTTESTIFKKQLDELVLKYPDQFTLNYIYTQQPSESKLFEGRINRDKFNAIIQSDIELLKANGFFLCGPQQMINDISEGLEYLGIPKDKIHFELFVVTAEETKSDRAPSDFSGNSQLKVIMDGEEFEFELGVDGESILDAAIDQGVDAPFSCKGAVCCTCKAQVVEGSASMDMNYALSDAEVEEGFILSCQAHPTSEKVVIDFDVI